jgi:S1-C subfamily serine protease
MDKELLSFSKTARCIYTRYADDITFSSNQPMTVMFEGPPPPSGHFTPELLVPTLRQIFPSNGFNLNPDKVHYADEHSRRTVTGLKINEIINVDRRYVRNIRAALYSVETLGEKAAQDNFTRKYSGASEIGAHLQGKIIWLRHIRGQSDPVFRAIAVRFNNSFPNRKIEVTPTAAEVRDRAVWIVEHFEGEMAQGSAFFLKGIGLVTAAHCVDGVEEVDVYHASKRANVFKAKVQKRDEHRDLAILAHSIAATEYFELEISARAVVVGDELLAVGYPGFGPGDGLNIRAGQVSSLPIRHGVKLIEVTQKLSQGMSGGPLLCKDNSVSGVIHKGGPSEERDFAIHIDVLSSWISE